MEIENWLRDSPTSLAVVVVTVLLMSCQGVFNPAQTAAESSFQEFVSRESIPYRNVNYDVLDNDGTYAHVQITADLRPWADIEWREFTVTIECREVGDTWLCDGIQTMGYSQRQQDAILAVTQTAVQEWESLQKAVQVEVTDHFCSSSDDTYLVEARVTNSDTQAHNVSLFVQVISGSLYRSDNRWLAGGLDLLIEADTSEVVEVEITIGGGIDPDQLCPVPHIVQICAAISGIDGRGIQEDDDFWQWRMAPSRSCSIW